MDHRTNKEDVKMNHKNVIKGPKFHNWVKGGLALRYLQNGLCDFVKVVSTRQHEKIKNDIELNPDNLCENRDCIVKLLKPHPCEKGPGNIDVCPEENPNCTCTRTNECPNKICDRMKKAIIDCEKSRHPNWTNIDIKRCQVSPWEIQKCFIKGPGYDQTESADHTDAAGLLLLICHNTYFRSFMSSSTEQLGKIRHWRGSVLFHSGNMELDEQQLKSAIDDIKTILQDEGELKSMDCAKQALRNIEELENERFRITLDHEADILKDSVESVQKELQILEKRIADLERFKKEQQEYLKEIEERKGEETNTVYVDSVENLQVGSNNQMYVENRNGMRALRNDLSPDSELDGLASIPKERAAPVQNRDPNTRTYADALRTKQATSPKTNIVHVRSGKNLQVGSNNSMKVQNSMNSRRSSRNDPSQDSEQEWLTSIPKERVVPMQDRDQQTQTDVKQIIYDVLNSNRKVTFEDIDVCCEHVGSWQRFLRLLGLDESLLTQLNQHYSAAGVHEIISQGLGIWRRRAGENATVGTLARTLKRVECEDVIKYLSP